MQTNWVYSTFQNDSDYAELLTFYVEEIPLIGSQLIELGKSRAFDDLRKEAHKLRGSAGGFGFPGVSDLAGRLEDSCRNPERDMDTILRSLDDLLEYLKRVRA